MESQDTTEKRVRISTSIALSDAKDLQAFCKRHPVYGVSVAIKSEHPEENICHIEMNFRAQSKPLYHQTMIHLFLAYANERYYKINQKIIG